MATKSAKYSTVSRAGSIVINTGFTVKPVFITIDPARDTVEYLADFVANNHSEMVGLTGTAEQIAKAARAFKVMTANAVTPEAMGNAH